MSLKQTLQNDLTESIRGRDELTSATIRMLLTAITNEEVAGKEARTLTDTEIIAVLSREAKKRKEAAEAFAQGGRSDRADRELAEGGVIAKYLPEALSSEELNNMIASAISAAGVSGPSGRSEEHRLNSSH